MFAGVSAAGSIPPVPTPPPPTEEYLLTLVPQPSARVEVLAQPGDHAATHKYQWALNGNQVPQYNGCLLTVPVTDTRSLNNITCRVRSLPPAAV